MPDHKVAMLTAGGLAPCLSSAVASLIERYSELLPDVPIIGYKSGYAGLLKGEFITVSQKVRQEASRLHQHGGSPLGNSRVKLTNRDDCVKRGLVKEGQDPLAVAAEQLAKDGVTILHTIGGDDTNTTAADLAAFLAKHNYKLTVVGLPKTVDNDVIPIRQTLGAVTAAEQGAIFFENLINERSGSERMLLVHEIMGRNCGWLTAATAHSYRRRLDFLQFVPDFGLARRNKDIDAIYVPEMAIDLPQEAERLKKVMNDKKCVTIFVSEGAGVKDIVAAMEERGQTVAKDAFGHVRLDSINVGQWFGKQFAELIGAEKVLVQKSGYFARSAAANSEDLRLIKGMVDSAVEAALKGQSGVIGHDEDRHHILRAIEFDRIKGGKAFDIHCPWFSHMLGEIKQANTNLRDE